MDFKDTLSLFETDMPIRVNHKELDNKMYNFYESNAIFDVILESSKGRKKYTLHDGPPYANGPIHLGHAYNKIMKDICIRSHFMMGYDAYTTPGWDCHGLPIEHKVMQENKNYTCVEMKKVCREYANRWVDNQKESFKKLSVMMDFEKPYKTMNFDYQANILRSFAKLVQGGYINRSNKTIPWCCGCQTTLATAEIEYQNRKDPSLYVLFQILQDIFYKKYFEDYASISFVIWTTTPWTLPLNRGVMIKKNAQYVLLQSEGKYLIIGKDCLEHFTQKTNKLYEIIREIHSVKLENLRLMHPFEDNVFVPVICDDSVELKEGTACVHTAPGCGPIDYEIGIKNKLEIYSPISFDGIYTSHVKVSALVGMKIQDAQGWVITKLQEKGILWHKGIINHSYPHCWRSKEGLIFRATPQWFCNLEKDNFKEKVINAIDKINFYPMSSKSFLRSSVINRWEWCISRQRMWGVPIVALINKNDGSYWTSFEFINYIASQVDTHGVEYWDMVTFADLKDYIPSYITEEEWYKETDILDVWFDSGVSNFAVLAQQGKFPADVYLEGVDQHRGWFQSSLLTSIAINGHMPMKSIVSCGHTIDEKGQKMSKSLGNVTTPDEIIDMIGLDGLRLWVASVNLGGDIVVAKKVFNNVSEVYRKIRNTCRFAIQNVVDFDPMNDLLSYKELRFFDQIIIQKMFIYQVKIIDAYQNYNFPEVYHTFIEIASTFLSSFYFDTLKDVLYCDKRNGKKRRSAQTVLYTILEMLTRLMAPILPYTAEDISNYYKSSKSRSISAEGFYYCDFFKDMVWIENLFSNKEESFFDRETISSINKAVKSHKQVDHFITILAALREEVFKATESLREKNIIKQSIEAAIDIEYADSSYYAEVLNLLEVSLLGEEFLQTLCQLLCVSDINLKKVTSAYLDNKEDKQLVKVTAIKHTGNKCERCWKYYYDNNLGISENLCKRCVDVINSCK